MVSYYHQVYSHTVFSLTHSPIHVIPVNTSMVSYYHQVITHCSERTCAPTHTPMVSYYHQVYPLTALRELVLPLTSFHLLLSTNASQMHHQCITNHLPHSPTHHASITSSSPHHLFLSPITTNRFLSLHTTLLTPFYHSQPSQSSPKSSPISIHTHNDNSRTP